MADGAPKAPYADLPPRDITDADLQFLSDYTGERDLAALRQHVPGRLARRQGSGTLSGHRLLCGLIAVCNMQLCGTSHLSFSFGAFMYAQGNGYVCS